MEESNEIILSRVNFSVAVSKEAFEEKELFSIIIKIKWKE